MLAFSMRLNLRKGMCTMHREMHLVLRPSRLLLNALCGTMQSTSLREAMH